MAEWTHRYVRVNGINLHYVEQGTGIPVILCHDFPHTWFSWRHQIPAIAKAGFRAIAIDMRGMGQTDSPADPRAYDIDHFVGDMKDLLDHLGAKKAVFSGLGFGAFACYDFALRAPERVLGVIGLENPPLPFDPNLPPLTEYAEMAKKHFLHIHYFVSQPGIADRALADNTREFLTKVFFALSGDYNYVDMWKHPPGTTYLDALPIPPPLPWPWLSELEMEFYVADYARSGFTGGLNWYRAMDHRWEQRKPFQGKKITVPFYFIGSENDVDLELFQGDDPLVKMRENFSDLREVAMIKKAGHMVQMERPDETNVHFVRFLQALAPTAQTQRAATR
jgi:pimeloyl-ACP methyl ester carboxylesterase